MIRAQIYLTKQERQKLSSLAQETGKSQSELIREAIDQFIADRQSKKQDKMALLKAAKGMWAGRKDLPDFSKLRNEFDRKI